MALSNSLAIRTCGTVFSLSLKAFFNFMKFYIFINETKTQNNSENDTIPIEKIVAQNYEKYSKIQHYKMLSKPHITITRYLLSKY